MNIWPVASACVTQRAQLSALQLAFIIRVLFVKNVSLKMYVGCPSAPFREEM